MVTYLTGDIFQSKAQVITNPVNRRGVMGGGLAAQFKRKYPKMFSEYKKMCSSGDVHVGRPYLWEGEEIEVLNFPTKDDWRKPSRLEYVESGLKYLAENYQQMGVATIAMPALGCGLGGLEWPEVSKLIEHYFGQVSDIEVFVYVPPEAANNKLFEEQAGKGDVAASSGFAAGEAEL